MRRRLIAPAIISAILVAVSYSWAGEQKELKLLFYAPFDGDFQPQVAAEKAAPTVRGTIPFQAGKFGQAALLAKPNSLSYAETGNLDKAQGTICMWVCPGWSGSKDTENRAFLVDDQPDDLGNNRIRLWRHTYGDLRFDVRDPGGHYIVTSAAHWKAGEWHHIAATWDHEVGTSLFMDGKVQAARTFIWEPKAGKNITIGSGWAGADALIDEVRIYNQPLTPGQIQRVMARHKLEPVVYEAIKVLGQIAIDQKFSIKALISAPEGLTGQYPIRVKIDDLDLPVSPSQLPSPTGQPATGSWIGPFTSWIPSYYYLAPGKHRLSVELSGSVGRQVANSQAEVTLVMPKRPAGPRIWEFTSDGKVLRNGRPYLVPGKGHGFLFEGIFYPYDRKGERKAGGLVESGRIVDAIPCRLVDWVDCTREDHEFEEFGQTQILELASGTKFRVSGRQQDVQQTKLRRGTKRKVLPGFSYTLRCEPRPTPHFLVVESVNDMERYLEVAIDAAPGSEIGQHLKTSGVGNRRLVNMAVIYTGREHPTDGKPFRQAFIFFPKTDQVQVTITASRRGKQETPKSGAAVSKMWIYEAAVPLADLENPIQPVPDLPQRSLSLFYPWTPSIFEEYGFSGASPEQRQASVRATCEYLKFLGLNRLEFHPYAFAPQAHFKSKLFPQRGKLDVFDDILPVTEQAGIWVLPRIDCLMFFFPEVDNPDDFQQGLAGKTAIKVEGKTAPDPLRPRTQKLLLDVLGEMLERSRPYQNVVGVGFRALGATPGWGGALYTGLARDGWPELSGYSKWDIEQFEQETGIKVEADPDDHLHRYEWIRAHAWDKWINWRCQKIHDWWCRARDLVQSYGPEKKLFVKTMISGNVPASTGEWWDRGTPPMLMHKHRGYDPALFKDEKGMVIDRTMLVGSDRYFVSPKDWQNKAYCYDPRLTHLYDTPQGNSVEFYFIYWELGNHPRGFRVGPESPRGRAVLEPMLYTLRTANSYHFTCYNWCRATSGYELTLREFARAFRALPAVEPKEFRGKVEVEGSLPNEWLWIRWFGDRLAVVNDSAQSRRVRLTLDRPLKPAQKLFDLALNQVVSVDRSGSVTLNLRPYDLRTLISR